MPKKIKFYDDYFDVLKQYDIPFTRNEKALKAMVKAEKYVDAHLDELIKKYPGKMLGFSDEKIFIGEDYSEMVKELDKAGATIPFFAFEVPEK